MSEIESTIDVAVIGAGLLGSAAAYYLSSAGASVIVLERGDINGQASTQNAGSLHFQLRGHAMHSQEQSAAERFEITYPLIKDAKSRWASLEAELGRDLEVTMHGGLMVAESSDDVRLLEEKVAFENSLGMNSRMVDGDEARELEPLLSETVLAASWFADEGHANPRLVAPAFIEGAMRLGALVRTHTSVRDLGRRSAVWNVGLEDGSNLQARTVLVAAGAWSGQVVGLADFRLPVIPLGLSMSVTERAGGVLSRLIQHSRQRLTMKQVKDGNVLIGGGWPSAICHDAGTPVLDRPPLPILDSIVGNVALASRVVPAVRELLLLRSWTGLQGVPPDFLPTLGGIPRRPGLFVANADVVGFSLGPTYASVVTDHILGRRPRFAVEHYSPDRFGHLNYV